MLLQSLETVVKMHVTFMKRRALPLRTFFLILVEIDREKGTHSDTLTGTTVTYSDTLKCAIYKKKAF
jgi:hypothetical protein